MMQNRHMFIKLKKLKQIHCLIWETEINKDSLRAQYHFNAWKKTSQIVLQDKTIYIVYSLLCNKVPQLCYIDYTKLSYHNFLSMISKENKYYPQKLFCIHAG